MIDFEYYIGYTIASSVAAALTFIIWYDTNALPEYARALGFKLKDYEKSERLGIPFPDYLEIRCNNFITRLIACPICLAVWLQIGAYFLHKSFWVSLFSIYFSLILYFLFKIIMRKADG